jgi:hypothetical protein
MNAMTDSPTNQKEVEEAQNNDDDEDGNPKKPFKKTLRIFGTKKKNSH